MTWQTPLGFAVWKRRRQVSGFVRAQHSLRCAGLTSHMLRAEENAHAAAQLKMRIDGAGGQVASRPPLALRFLRTQSSVLTQLLPCQDIPTEEHIARLKARREEVVSF
eukprot:1714460-Rhodomonas_salina.1